MPEPRVWTLPDPPGPVVECRVQYPTTDRTARIVHCGLPIGHDGPHCEEDGAPEWTVDKAVVKAAGRSQDEARGYARAVAMLRDDQRYKRWWTKLAPDFPDYRYWDFGRGQLADYLETVERLDPAADHG